MKTSMIKFSGIIHKRGNQSNPRLAWLVFSNIYILYHYIKNKEESNAAVILTSMTEHEQPRKLNK